MVFQACQPPPTTRDPANLSEPLSLLVNGPAGKDGSKGLGMSSLKAEDAIADYSGLTCVILVRHCVEAETDDPIYFFLG